jgi:hypothetical protein
VLVACFIPRESLTEMEGKPGSVYSLFRGGLRLGVCAWWLPEVILAKVWYGNR